MSECRKERKTLKKKNEKARHFWRRVATWLSVLVVFCTTYALILPAVTLEGKTYCDKEEHIHTDECYAIASSNETDMLADPSDQDDEGETSAFSSDDQDTENTSHKELICGKEAHEHTLQCYSNPNLKESRAHWNDSLPNVAEANNSLSELIYLTAHSQLNYNPAKEDTHLNYQVQEDGTTKFYWNRYAAFADANNPYVQDNSVFVNFVLKHSDNMLPWKQDVNEWQSLEYIDPYADNNIDASLWQSSWQQVLPNQAKRGAVVLFRNDTTADDQSSSSFESQSVTTENSDGTEENTDSDEDEIDGSINESSSLKLEAGILTEDLIADNETESASPESTDPITEEGFDFSSDFNSDPDSSNSAATESQPIEDLLVISTWKDQKPEERRIDVDQIVGIYQVKNDAIDPTHITDDDADEKKDEDQNPTTPDQNQNQTSGTPSDGTGTTTEVPDSDDVTDPDGSNNGLTTESPTNPDQSGTPTDQNPSNSTDGKTDGSNPSGEDDEDKNQNDSGTETSTPEKSDEDVVGEVAVETGSKDKAEISISKADTAVQSNLNKIKTAPNIQEALNKEALAIDGDVIPTSATPITQSMTVNYRLEYPEDSNGLSNVKGYKYPDNPQLSNTKPEQLQRGFTGSLTIRDLTSRIYRTDASQGSSLKNTYYFHGWKAYKYIDRDGYTEISHKLYLPGENIDSDDLEGLRKKTPDKGDYSNVVYFKPVWSPSDATSDDDESKVRGTVMFSVNFNMDAINDYSRQDVVVSYGSFVDRLYCTALNVEEINTETQESTQVLNLNTVFPDGGLSVGGTAFIAYQSASSVKLNGNGLWKNTDERTRTIRGTDALIRSLASEEGVTTGAVAVGANGQNITYDQHEGKIYNFKLASFPEDEQILNQLKVYQTSAAEYAKIKYADGTNVAASDLVPDNFTIVWYIFKLGEGEGAWHIDGNLIPKSSYLKITKSFSGDEDVVGQMENKDKYSLTLKDDTTHTIGNKEYSFEKQLVLSDNSEQNPPVDEITLGDPAHVTETISAAKVENADGSYSYTWTIPVHSFENYTITENNYDYYVVYPPNDPSSLNNVVTLAQFNVTNTTTVNGKDTVTDVNQLTTYTDSGVKIYTQPYLDSQGTKSFQTVNFRNSYFRTTDLEINKVDATSGNVLAGAQFKLSKIDSDGNEVETHFYSNVSANKNTLYIYPAAVTGTSELINNTFTIGEGVSVILKNFRDSEYTGTYTLEEIEAPTGYTKLGEKIRIEIDSRGNIVNAEDSDLIEWVCIPIDDDDDLVSAIRIKNKPELVDILIKKQCH